MPICSFCLKSGIYCSTCREKIEKGEVTPLDLEIAKQLLELENRFPNLKEAEFRRSVETNNLVIIVVGPGDISHFIGPKGKIVKILSDRLKKKIRVIEGDSSTKKTIEDILSPVSVLGVNTIWLPDGTLEKKVRIRKSDIRRLPTSVSTLEEVVHKLTNEKVRIVFE
ncbi:MAG: transcription elongation factor NusA [Candidatus Freyrarchaeum guaymaensis]|nr:transcription elongation factor NusA [Candidatus Sigynarchaeota archaeon]